MYIQKSSDSLMEWNTIITVDNYKIQLKEWLCFTFTTKSWYYDDTDFNDTISNIIDTVIFDYKRWNSSVVDYSSYKIQEMKEYLLSEEWKLKEKERVEWMINIEKRKLYDLENVLEDIYQNK